VKGDIPATLDLVHLDAARPEAIRRRDDVRVFRRPSERDDRGMLEQKQYVFVDLAGDAPSREITLQLQGDRVRHCPEA
jgi:hypothetical protein